VKLHELSSDKVIQNIIRNYNAYRGLNINLNFFMRAKSLYSKILITNIQEMYVSSNFSQKFSIRYLWLRST